MLSLAKVGSNSWLSEKILLHKLGLANDAVTIILYQTVIGIVMNTDQSNNYYIAIF